MKKTKVLLITNLYPNPQEPNRGIFVENMARCLREHCDITVVSPLPWFPKLKILRRCAAWHKFSQVPQEFEINRQKVVCPKYLAIPNMGFLHGFFLFMAIWPQVRRLHQEIKFDLINAHWLFPDGVAAAWTAKLLKLPLVLSAHGTDINLYLKMRMRVPQIIAALNQARAITVVSRQHWQALESLGIDSRKITLVSNGYDELFYPGDKQAARQGLGITHNKKMIVFAGRLVEVKGLNFLIEAVNLLAKQGNNGFQLAVVGNGPLRQAYVNMVQRLGLEQHICFYGEKKHSEIADWFAASDVVCLPSVSEGCPTVVIEALACGRPVVAAKVGEVPNLINNNNGVLFEPKNIEQMAGAVQQTLNKDWDEQAIRGSVSEMTWQKISENYAKVYQDALARC